MKALFDETGLKISKLVTNSYSTSFSMGISLFDSSLRPAIYAIYGFVRFADEIVDSFHGYDKALLLAEFEAEYQKSLTRGISLNPILNSFQAVVNQYKIHDLVEAFLVSMRLDLSKKEYQSKEEYEAYIYGSADAVGLMCLKIFVGGDEKRYEELKPMASSLGSAFQKVNFLRDIKNDVQDLGRSYFPDFEGGKMDKTTKEAIVANIQKDFDEAYKGILQLPATCQLGVYVAYRYYLQLLHQLKGKKVEDLMDARIRVADWQKGVIFLKSYLRFKGNII